MSEKVKTPGEMNFDINHAEAWKFFIQKFKLFLMASKSDEESEEYKCALLLNHIGDKGLKIYNTFSFAKKEDEKKYTQVLEKFEEYFRPAKNVTYERHIFLTRDMKNSETVDEYVTTLRELSFTCEFGSLTDSLIKDKLVQGIKDKAVKDRLLRTKGLDLPKAIDICKAAETTKTQLEEICAGTSKINMEEDIHKVTVNRNKNLTKNDPSRQRRNRIPRPSQWWRQNSQNSKMAATVNTNQRWQGKW